MFFTISSLQTSAVFVFRLQTMKKLFVSLTALQLLLQTAVLHAYESKEACINILISEQSDAELIKMICDSPNYPKPLTEKEKEWEKERERLQEEALAEGVDARINIDNSLWKIDEQMQASRGGNLVFDAQESKARFKKERLRAFCAPYKEARRQQWKNYYNTAPSNRKYLPNPHAIMAWPSHSDCG